ncbi:2-amino-4-hydroxy-6-hydroxymethyldihydropteridine diphosphokinase [Pseudidiomarina sediminum]|uniref:2-amino-4-hydroxy-6-hydroxymethyldihydropteridine pyrophosphokinase n=1 Tax=Pseudidiomarina sediminum TaxID=431675 RepID=A0A432Z3X0_9GAMM|nr:2-amino-4-hydroxy-6-hydroxymethyldihydropteridine diphosphokinase [Pseudidiomarina sediminum]MBY6062767.1 2-amino-4-hydroxy-6-hydroxymethyldihydropteridine diphosphokinase [Pseudidiomarina sediminum]RUO72571.1 2-amino-4-hydroxy-6-hydroxymethyldihydropteridine diphosphokinase [Pseudidiomarina sediminum]
MAQQFLCSMGANLAPEKNFALARQQLDALGTVTYSLADYTQPVAIETDHEFLNALFVIATDLDAIALKQQFNRIEEQLGRDRSDPLSSQKDRPMDIDILANILQEPWPELPDYLTPMANDIRRRLSAVTDQELS